MSGHYHYLTGCKNIRDTAGCHCGREPRPLEACDPVSDSNGFGHGGLLNPGDQIVQGCVILMLALLQLTQSVKQLAGGHGRCYTAIDRMLGRGLIAEPGGIWPRRRHISELDSSWKRGKSLEMMYRTMATSGSA